MRRRETSFRYRQAPTLCGKDRDFARVLSKSYWIRLARKCSGCRKYRLLLDWTLKCVTNLTVMDEMARLLGKTNFSVPQTSVSSVGGASARTMRD